MDLAQKKCVPCEVKIPAFTPAQVAEYMKQLNLPWDAEDGKKLRHLFKFNIFSEAMEFVNKMAKIAEAESHHPDFTVSYNKVTVEITTHFIGGLSENDFILARKIELLV